MGVGRMMGMAVLATAGLLTMGTAGAVDTPEGCVVIAATGAESCTIVAGAENSGTHTPEDVLVIGERVSWIASGEWMVERLAASCTGDALVTWSSEANDPNIGGVSTGTTAAGTTSTATRRRL